MHPANIFSNNTVSGADVLGYEGIQIISITAFALRSLLGLLTSGLE